MPARAGGADTRRERARMRFAPGGGVVSDVIRALDETAEKLRPAEREAVARCFVTTSRYEWMFWDMGYRREGWPV